MQCVAKHFHICFLILGNFLLKYFFLICTICKKCQNFCWSFIHKTESILSKSSCSSKVFIIINIESPNIFRKATDHYFDLKEMKTNSELDFHYIKLKLASSLVLFFPFIKPAIKDTKNDSAKEVASSDERTETARVVKAPALLFHDQVFSLYILNPTNDIWIKRQAELLPKRVWACKCTACFTCRNKEKGDGQVAAPWHLFVCILLLAQQVFVCSAIPCFAGGWSRWLEPPQCDKNLLFSQAAATEPWSEEPQAEQIQRFAEGTRTDCGAATAQVSKGCLILKIKRFSLWWAGKEISAAAVHVSRSFRWA